MKPHRDALDQEAAIEAREQRKQGDERNARVATWILVGNGAALLACFNAVVGGDVSHWEPLRPFALTFWLGIVCAVASVVLQGEARDRSTRRLMLIMGATRRAAICTDANEAFLEAGPGTWDAETKQQIEKNVDEAQRAIVEIESLREEPASQQQLMHSSQIWTVVAALCFALGLLVAIAGNVVNEVVAT